MGNDSSALVQKLWNYCNVLRDDGVSYGDYVEQLKTKSPEQLMETAGPMVMWELVAQKLEKLVEKIKK